MDEGYVDFNVNMGKWKTTYRHDVKGDLVTFADSMSIAHATEGVDAVVEDALRAILSLEKVDQAIQEGGSDAGKALTALSSRKFGKLLTELCDVSGWQAKEKKMIQEVIRFYAARKILREGGWEINYGIPPRHFSTGKISEGNIQFIANYAAWKCIKKFHVNTSMNRRTLAEFMISYNITLDLRFETYLTRILKLNELEAFLQKSPGKAATFEELVRFLSQPELTTILQKISSTVSPDQRSRCELILRAYAARKVLKEKGLIIEPMQIKSLPGWKRVVGKRK